MIPAEVDPAKLCPVSRHLDRLFLNHLLGYRKDLATAHHRDAVDACLALVPRVTSDDLGTTLFGDVLGILDIHHRQVTEWLVRLGIELADHFGHAKQRSGCDVGDATR